MKPLLLLLCVVMLGSMASAAPREHPAKGDLLADVSTAAPGSTFNLAVRIRMKPDWHVYWTNPGDSGTATEVTFTGPAGYVIQPLPLPTPKQFSQPGDMVGFGYENTVLLLAKVTVPKDAKPGDQAEFTAKAQWLVCKDVCIPGKADLTLSIPIADQSAPANEALIGEWLAQVPTPARESAEVELAGSKGGGKSITLVWKQPVKNVQAFVAPGDDWRVRDLKTVHADQKTVITLTPEALSKTAVPADLPVLVAFDDSTGQRRSVMLTCPIARAD